MRKNLDLKNRIVEYYDADTALIEDEIIGFLDRNVKVRFYSAHFNNNKWVFIGTAADRSPNSITVSQYRKKQLGEKTSVSIG